MAAATIAATGIGSRSICAGIFTSSRPTFAAMAATIAVISALYCLALVAVAGAVTQQVRSHRTALRWLQRLAGIFLVGFGLRLAFFK